MDRKVLINLLVELATAETEWLAARQVQTGHDVRTRHLDELQAEIRRDAEQAEAAEDQLRRRLRDRERRLAEVEEDLRAREERRRTLADERQLEAVRSEIRTLEQGKSRLEGEVLELLERLGEGDREADEAQRQWRRQQERQAAEQQEMAAGVSRAEACERETLQEIERLVGLLPPDLQRQVRRLRRGLDRAVVFLEGKACSGCFAQLPPQQAISAERGREIVRCESCARYVVHRPWR